MAAELEQSSSSSQAASDSEAVPRLPEDENADELRPSLDLSSLASGGKGTGPRLFCGHVPKEVNDDMVRQHFSKWGTVSDVYFPRHKKTLKRRPFCFVTFANKEDAERALAESGLEIGGVAIKNLTMVEDRDKYYTNKHATARQALLQALKQLGPASGAPVTGAASAAAGGALPNGTAGVSAEQLSNLAAIMALEGVHSDVVLQTLGLPTSAEAAAAVAVAAGAPPSSAPVPALAANGLSALDSASLLQALGASPSLSSQTTFDLRSSFDLPAAMRSTGTSMDLSGLQQGLAAAAAAGMPLDGVPAGARMHPTDSRSTLASADWSHAPSARTSLDAVLLPAATAGFLAGAAAMGPAPSLGSLHTRLSLDAALQLQQAQQVAAQQQALLASHQARLSASAYPLPPAAPQAALSSVMHSGFYQAQAPAVGAPSPNVQPEVQHSMHTVMSSGLYGNAPPPPTRHSMHELSSVGSGMLPYGDAAWLPQHHQQQQLAGYSTVLRPSIDRAGLPPLPPRNPHQELLNRQSINGSPDSMLVGHAPAAWPVPGGVAV